MRGNPFLKQNNERSTTVNINKLRTRRIFTLVTVAAVMLVILLTVSVSALSLLIDGDANQSDYAQAHNYNFIAASADNAGSLTDENNLSNVTENMPAVGTGPVNIVLVKHGEVSKHAYFPVECSVFLKHEGIELTENDVINFSDDTVLYENMVINIGKIEYVEEVVTDIIPYDVKERSVQTIPKGTRQVVQKGANGSIERTYVSKYVNGQKIEEVLYSENIVAYPVEEIANVGVGGTITGKDGKTYNYSYYKTMEATAYTYVPGKTTTTTATGRTLEKGIVAVDPKVIPLHTKLYITGSIEYGYGEAEDTGGAIKGNIIDLAFMTYDECIQFGRRKVTVYILE